MISKVLWMFILSSSLLATGAHFHRTKKNEKIISLDRKNLTQLRDSPMARGIKKSFCSATEILLTCPECVERFTNARQYRDLFDKRFLLVDAEPNDFGGYFMILVFENYSKVYWLWIYEIDEEFQIREMEPMKLSLNKVLMEELKHKDYFPYWSKATCAIPDPKSP